MLRMTALALALGAAALAFGCKDKHKDDNDHSLKIETSSRHDKSPAAQTAEDAPKYASFGAPMKLADSDSVTVQQLLTDPSAYNGKYVRVTGTVDQVCPKKGCWMTMHDASTDKSLRVKFPDPAHGRLIPMDAAGKPAIAEGVVKVRMLPEAEARHYAQDAGASQEELEKIQGPQPDVGITNGSAKIMGVESASAE